MSAPNILKKLMDARKAFHSKKLVKSGRNEFSNYSYFELSDFMPWAMECLNDQGLVPIVSFSKTYATMTVYDIEEDSKFEITSPMSSAKLKACHEVQNLGAVQTYERRYLWLALMEVVEGDPVESVAVVHLATPEQIASLHEYAEAGLMTDGQKMWLEKASDKMTEEQAAYVLEKLKEKEAEE